MCRSRREADLEWDAIHEIGCEKGSAAPVPPRLLPCFLPDISDAQHIGRTRRAERHAGGHNIGDVDASRDTARLRAMVNGKAVKSWKTDIEGLQTSPVECPAVQFCVRTLPGAV